MVRLFIENNELEITQDISIAITKQFEELTNPTSIINDWSKTVSIPFSVKNNQIFGYIFREDRKIATGGSSSVGIYFDPLKKLDMRIEWSGVILMIGYAKLNEIKQVNGKGTYEITLFGQLGKLFQDMKKITFDNSTSETAYLINGSNYVNEKINRSLVYSSWTSSGQIESTLQNKYINSISPGGQITQLPNPNYHVTDIIGFAPNNSFSEDFKYDTYQSSNNTSDTFVNELGDSFTEATGVQPETLLKDGVMPREIGEYRSYHQLPFIYWNKLFQVFKNKAQSVTGYTFDLDSEWFSTSNPYWYKLVYMLKPFDTKKGQLYDNTYKLGFGTPTQYMSSVSWNVSGYHATSPIWQENRDYSYFLAVSDESVEVKPICDFETPFSSWQITSDANTVFNLPMRIYFDDGNPSNISDVESQWSYLTDDNGLIITVTMTGSNGTTQTQKVLVKKSTATSVTEDGATVVLNDTHLGPRIMTYFEVYFNTSGIDYGTSVTFSVSMNWKTQNTPSTYTNNAPHISVALTRNYNKDAEVNIMANMFKSNSSFTLNDLWNNDYNLFGEILKYCKMYRIGISVDNIAKKIIFKPLKKYFTTYSAEDWTEKIDKSKDYTITPVTLEDKYIMFNYKDIDTKLAKEYKEKYGVNYGDYRLITYYNFNSNTKNLFDNITPSMTNTDNVLSWLNLKNNKKIIYSFPAEIYVYNKDKDNKQVSVFGAFYFHKGTKNFDTEAALNLVSPKITDDTNFQAAYNTYFYNRGGGNRTMVSTYPFLDIVYNDDLCVFNIPSENYTYLNNYSGKNSIYYNFWENYIDERYNIQNKKITCYVMLSPIEYNQFAWNKLVKVGNQLCMVNKIYDYDITANTPTKVDLITIQDISGYNETNY